jgi:hypothetical protein
MTQEAQKGKKITIITIVSFIVLIPGGAYVFQDYGYVGSGIGTLAWGAICLWYFSTKNSDDEKTIVSGVSREKHEENIID